MGTVAEGKRIRIRGTVQGVGFRPWVYRTAVEAGVSGRVWNDASGVTIDAYGDHESLDAFERALHLSPPPAARIVEFDTASIPAGSAETFVIEHSEGAAEHRVSIPPDLATCDDCVADILDPANRRYRYAFTNCTNCGPRFTIATDAPYDRAATTMAPFTMCAPCRHEYEDVRDRRFHAQPTACPECGPELTVVWTDGDEPAVVVPGFSRASQAHLKVGTTTDHDLASASPEAAADLKVRTTSDPEAHLKVGTTNVTTQDAIAIAADALRRGLIVAVKGIGGFHLACDATSDAAVARLRARKHRDEKPLAVMVPTIDAADALAHVGPVHRALLTSAERPIVLVDRRDHTTLASSIAPGNRQVGLLLPYSPLHHLLLADTARPLVMTSGNLSDEPIAFTNDDALARLRGIADLILLHNRKIHTRCDDSVATVVNGAPLLMRRSRGYVPRAISLAQGVRVPVLATGALLKNTFCLAKGTQAFPGPHIGDLENLETFDSFTQGIERFQRFVDIRPELVACDMHPDYLSTMYAEQRGEPVVRVQHHHAHVAAVMAEHGLTGPVIGLAYDGTGYGLDGTSWGGEILLATLRGFERLATFRPIALVGGDRAVREPWRVALALLHDAYDGAVPEAALALLGCVSAHDRDQMLGLIHKQVQVSLARGVGRYFDGFGALFLDRRTAAFEGQVALEWNQAASAAVDRGYPFALDQSTTPVEIDLRPAVRAAARERLAGVPASDISAAFHQTIARATASAVTQAMRTTGPLPVVASGGVFLNARLAEAVRAALGATDVRFHAQVPPGDGGLALGQVVVADAVSRG